MAEEVLFEITREKLETGMRGFPVGYCTTSHIDPQKGLFYRDKMISELAYWEPIQVIYLLYHGKTGSDSEVGHFDQELKKRACCSKAVVDAIESLPRAGHPM